MILNQDFALEHKQSLIPPHPQPFSKRERGVRISYYSESPFSTWEKGFRNEGILIMNILGLKIMFIILYKTFAKFRFEWKKIHSIKYIHSGVNYQCAGADCIYLSNGSVHQYDNSGCYFYFCTFSISKEIAAGGRLMFFEGWRKNILAKEDETDIEADFSCYYYILFMYNLCYIYYRYQNIFS